MNTDKNTALYEKMAAEQDKFRDWLKSQPPEEILKHTYEYTVRELSLIHIFYYEYEFNFYQIAAMEHCTASAIQKSVAIAKAVSYTHLPFACGQ